MNSLLNKTAGFYLAFQIAVITAFPVFIFANIRLGFIYPLAIEGINAVGMVLYKDYTKNPHKTFTVFRISLIMLAIHYAREFIIIAESGLNVRFPMVIRFMFFLTIGVFTAFFLFDKNEEKIKALDEIKVKEKLDKKGGDGEENDYDVIICREKETGKPVLLHGNDRFVHLLGIGPTGAGKTSQVIKTMVEQDIKKGHGIILIDPKGDLAGSVHAMGVYYDKPTEYFNPIFPDCPYLNPLDGDEDKVIETMTTIFIMLSPDSKTYFKDITNDLIGNALLVLKRLEKAYTNPKTGISERPATLITLSDILHNANNVGREMVQELARIPTLTPAEKKQNKDVMDWFLNEYFADRSKIYENTGGVRTQVSKLIRNKYLRRVMNPPDGKTQINFDKILEEGGRLVITTAQGELRELGSYLGYFIIFNLQAAIFRRKGTEFDRKPCFLYIDEFQKYANEGFEDILTQGRSYRVSANLFTQTRGLIEDNTSKGFAAVVDANCRNVIAFPGISTDDAKHFEDLFGEEDVVEVQKGESRQKFSLGYGIKDMNYPTVSERYIEKKQSRYTKTDIRFKPFGEITYMLINDKSMTYAGDGIADFLPKKLEEKLEKIEIEYARQQQSINERNEQEIKEQNDRLYADFLKIRNGDTKTSASGEERGQEKDSALSTNDKAREKRKQEKGMMNSEYDSRLQGAAPPSPEPSLDNPQDLKAEVEGYLNMGMPKQFDDLDDFLDDEETEDTVSYIMDDFVVERT